MTTQQELILTICHSIKHLISNINMKIELNAHKQENKIKKIILLK